MCRTLRGGRADAITVRTPWAGKHRSALTVCSLTCFESSSNVPSRSIATSRMAERPASTQAAVAAGSVVGGCFDADRLMACAERIIVAAPRAAGRSTHGANLARVQVDDQRLLERFAGNPLDGGSICLELLDVRGV